RRRIETQVLHFEDGSWRPYSYAWDDDQTDATLVAAEGSSRTLTVRDARAPGGRREQHYRFFARSECLQCHNPWVEKQTTMFGRQTASPLTANTLQLNTDHDYAGRIANQLQSFEHIGLFTKRLPASPEALPKLADPYDLSADLGQRARSYLHV